MAYVILTAVFVATALTTGLINIYRHKPHHALTAAAAGASGIAIAGPGSGIVGSLLDLIPGINYFPYLPQAGGLFLILWAETRFITPTIGLNLRRRAYGQRVTQRVVIGIGLTVTGLYLLSLYGGTTQEYCWFALGLACFIGCVLIATQCAVNLSDCVVRLYRRRALDVMVGVLGLEIFATVSVICVVDPTAIRLHIFAAVGVMIMTLSGIIRPGTSRQKTSQMRQ